jgi:hypothetical protein
LYMLIGAAISLTIFACQMMRYRMSFFREWMTSETGSLSDSDLEKAAGSRNFQARMASIHVNGFFLLMLVLFLPSPKTATTGFFIISISTQLVPSFLWLIGVLTEGSILLKRGRISRSASV